MEKKKTKKKLTLSISTTKTYNVSDYKQNKGKTSVVVEKKPPRRWGEKKFQSRENNFNKTKFSSNFSPKKPSVNRNFDIRKMAEERATKRLKDEKENLQSKKGLQGRGKGSAPKREYKLTISKALTDDEIDIKERSLASVRRARMKEKKNLDAEKTKIET